MLAHLFELITFFFFFFRYERKGTKEITLVLEYLPGGDLFSLLLARKTFSMEMTRFYTACAYFALIHMHSRNILCRDLKLENMAIARDGNLKLIDLGLAKCSTKKCYTVCGSPEIISPPSVLTPQRSNKSESESSSPKNK